MDRYFAGFLIVYLTIDRYEAPWISGRLWYALWYGSGGSCPCFLGLGRRRKRREMTCRGSVLVPHQGSSRERSPERCSTKRERLQQLGDLEAALASTDEGYRSAWQAERAPKIITCCPLGTQYRLQSLHPTQAELERGLVTR
jgi:hypothetical protein